MPRILYRGRGAMVMPDADPAFNEGATATLEVEPEGARLIHELGALALDVQRGGRATVRPDVYAVPRGSVLAALEVVGGEARVGWQDGSLIYAIEVVLHLHGGGRSRGTMAFEGSAPGWVRDAAPPRVVH